ncbi:hypothetical protein LTR86_009086 [Recurvomyces mirabilis]|nr:hypothetical protein LTR86_009086 [Recurvomyces mirabilis]
MEVDGGPNVGVSNADVPESTTAAAGPERAASNSGPPAYIAVPAVRAQDQSAAIAFQQVCHASLVTPNHNEQELAHVTATPTPEDDIARVRNFRAHFGNAYWAAIHLHQRSNHLVLGAFISGLGCPLSDTASPTVVSLKRDLAGLPQARQQELMALWAAREVELAAQILERFLPQRASNLRSIYAALAQTNRR